MQINYICNLSVIIAAIFVRLVFTFVNKKGKEKIMMDRTMKKIKYFVSHPATFFIVVLIVLLIMLLVAKAGNI